MTADNQMDDDARADARELIMATAELFDIPTHKFEYESTEEDNTIVIKIHTDSNNNNDKPKLTLVSDNTPNNDNNDNTP